MENIDSLSMFVLLILYDLLIYLILKSLASLYFDSFRLWRQLCVGKGVQGKDALSFLSLVLAVSLVSSSHPPCTCRCFQQEVKEEEAGSEADPEEGMELKEECGEGEGPYLSEVERAASESEDGYGPPSQRYTADSLASSPASSSQLYVPSLWRRIRSCDLVLLLLLF